MICKDCNEEIVVVETALVQEEYPTDAKGNAIWDEGQEWEDGVTEHGDSHFNTYCCCDEGDPEACPYEFQPATGLVLKEPHR